MKVLITGSRHWSDVSLVVDELSKLPIGSIIVHGYARGADEISDLTSREMGFTVRTYPADWGRFKRSAGPIRNQQMLNEEHLVSEPINLCIAFNDDLCGSQGTRDMVERVTRATPVIPWRNVRTPMKIINHFTKEFRFLSNFWPCTVRYDGVLYPTVEHAYQASKTLDAGERETIRALKSPGDAKRAGKTVTVRGDWSDIKISIMRELVTQKFKNPFLAPLLLATGDAQLLEIVTWHDNFWGVCKCKNCPGIGENNLGKILIEVRDIVRSDTENGLV